MQQKTQCLSVFWRIAMCFSGRLSDPRQIAPREIPFYSTALRCICALSRIPFFATILILHDIVVFDYKDFHIWEKIEEQVP